MGQKNLSFSTGLVTYTINGGESITFNPTDPTFIGRLYSTFDALEAKQASYKTEMALLTEAKEILAFTASLDAEMRTAIDGIFLGPVCAKVFPPVGLYSSSDGLPLWCNFILAVIDEVNEAMKASDQGGNERVRKYMEKYKR